MDLFIVKTWLESKFASDERGASMVEYGLLLALIAVVCVGAVSVLGVSISGMLSGLATTI